MSRLIRNDAAVEADAGTARMITDPLQPQDAVEHLKTCQKIAVDHARHAFGQFLAALEAALDGAVEAARSNTEASEIGGIQRLVRRTGGEVERHFIRCIAENYVKFQRNDLHTEINSGREREEEGLSLVDNDVLEETIAISTLTQKLGVYFAEPLWSLSQRLSLLNGGQNVADAGNPAAPVQACDALRRSLKMLSLTSKTKQLAYQVFEEPLTQLVRRVLDDTNGYLVGAGVLPKLRYQPPAVRTTMSPSPTDFSDQAEAKEQAAAAQQYQSSLVQAIRNLQYSLTPEATRQPLRAPFTSSGGRALAKAMVYGASSPGGSGELLPDRAELVVSSDQLLGVLQSLQAGNHATVANSISRNDLQAINLPEILAALGEQLKAQLDGASGRVSNSDMNTIDLVGLVFEYMLKDENLPDSVKALLSYLHTPFLKLAFVDPGFFEQHEHPARLLLNSLAEAGTRWIGNDGTIQHDMYNRIKDVVDRVLRDYKNDVRVITELLVEFNTQNKNLVRKQELLEKRAAEKARGEERLREVKLRVNSEIRRRIEGRQLPSAVLLFALQPWSDFLSFTMLRHGEQSERWDKALRVVDDLLWALETKTTAADIALQKELETSLTEDMSSGFETIGYDPAKGQKIIGAIASILRQAINREKMEAAPPPVRDELEKLAAEKAGKPFNPPERKLTDEEAKVLESLKMIEFGTWFEFEGGKRLKLAWYNPRTSQYMFLDQTGKMTDLKSGLEITREMIAKRAKIIAGSSKPFFERALENIFQKLKAQAEAQENSDGAK